MSVLRPITAAEYDAWLETVIPGYAEEKVASGQWPASSALERSLKEFAELLPQGRDTEDNHIYTILGAEGECVGTLWIAVKDRADRRIAYVYDIVIAPEHRRRGNAVRAFQALEEEVAGLGLGGIALHVFGHNYEAQALYRKLGNVATNIHMFKAVPAAAA